MLRDVRGGGWDRHDTRLNWMQGYGATLSRSNTLLGNYAENEGASGTECPPTPCFGGQGVERTQNKKLFGAGNVGRVMRERDGTEWSERLN